MSVATVDPAQALNERIAQLASVVEGLNSPTPAKKAARAGSNLAPSIRKGEDPFTSRGYSFTKLFQLLGGQIQKEFCRVEIDMHNDLHKHLFEARGWQRAEPNTILAPMGLELFPQTSEAEVKFVDQVRKCIGEGVRGFDPQELRAMAKRLPPHMRTKVLSWTDETAMGALVEPPLMGELIELLRNNEVFLAAGARTVGLPPQGRMIFPRQTGAGTFYYVGESDQITASNPTTGDLVLQAKKGAILVKVPNELFRYASISVEMFLRMDMTKTMGLGMDKQLLEGAGSSNSPKGLINYSGITSYTSKGTPADGNSGYPLQPEDVNNIIAQVEAENAVFRAFVSHPLEYAYITNRRADAVSAGDNKGPWMFNILREMSTSQELERTAVGNLSGYPFHKSTQISKVRTRGSGTTNNTYILGGDFSDYVLAVAPTIEFALTQQGDTPFQNDQTWIRAILPHDGAPRHEASFVLVDNLLY